MVNADEHKRNFSLVAAYDFLRSKGFTNEADSIQSSRDNFKSYKGTLKRAKILKVVSDHGILKEFIDSQWPYGNTTRGQSRLSFLLQLYKRFAGEEVEVEEEEEVETLEESQFAYESDLQNYLANNLHLIEPGLILYKEPDGKSGLEFLIDDRGRRVDILAIDRSGLPVVIELKVRQGHERTIGQALYYLAMVKRRLAKANARVIIVAREISEELRLASENIPDIELFEYKISMQLQRIAG